MDFNQIALAYREACGRVAAAIKNHPKYKLSWFREQLGFSSESSFYRRLNNANWEPEHLEKIALLLEGKAVI